jgi:hypothetical protein
MADAVAAVQVSDTTGDEQNDKCRFTKLFKNPFVSLFSFPNFLVGFIFVPLVF